MEQLMLQIVLIYAVLILGIIDNLAYTSVLKFLIEKKAYGMKKAVEIEAVDYILRGIVFIKFPFGDYAGKFIRTKSRYEYYLLDEIKSNEEGEFVRLRRTQQTYVYTLSIYSFFVLLGLLFYSFAPLF